jgi:hypothetical protein
VYELSVLCNIFIGLFSPETIQLRLYFGRVLGELVYYKRYHVVSGSERVLRYITEIHFIDAVWIHEILGDILARENGHPLVLQIGK